MRFSVGANTRSRSKASQRHFGDQINSEDYVETFIDAVKETSNPGKDSYAEFEENEYHTGFKAFDGFRAHLHHYLGKAQPFVIVLILVSALAMGIGTLPVVKKSATARDILDIMDKVFLYIFTVELAVGLLVKLHRFVFDRWLVFDTFVVVSSWVFAGTKVIRTLRIFRAFRLFGRIKSLQLIIVALSSTFEMFMSISLVLMIIIYIFAVMLTTLFHDCYDEGCYCETYPKCNYENPEQMGVDYFGRLDSTILTLCQLMSMDDFMTVVTQTQRGYWWAWFPILTFIIITGFVLMNLVVAVFCEVLNILNQESASKAGDGSQHDAHKQEEEPTFIVGSELSLIEGKTTLDQIEMTLKHIDDRVTVLEKKKSAVKGTTATEIIKVKQLTKDIGRMVAMILKVEYQEAELLKNV